ncbi:hypothetical protein ACFL5Z_13310, partial [Planctomycetota bacterium]
MTEQSKIHLFLEAEKRRQDQGTSCHHFVTTNPNFSKSSPKKCQILGQGHNLEKNLSGVIGNYASQASCRLIGYNEP